jgi:hypothetical protein
LMQLMKLWTDLDPMGLEDRLFLGASKIKLSPLSMVEKRLSIFL